MIEIRNKLVSLVDELIGSTMEGEYTIFDFPNGKDLKKYRKLLKLSLRDVAKETDVSITTISRLENGHEVFMSSYESLCKFYKKQIINKQVKI